MGSVLGREGWHRRNDQQFPDGRGLSKEIIVVDAAESERWRCVAAELAALTGDLGEVMDWSTLPIHPTVRAALQKCPNPRLLIACSGGADSLTVAGLFSVFRARSRGVGGDLALAHFDHGWRSDAADDAAFVAKFAETHGLTFFEGKAETDGMDSIKRTETAAREARLLFLRTSARRFKADAIVFGHHLGDVAETMLLRLARGASVEGLCCPRPVARFREGPEHWRPLLWIEPAQIRRALGAARIAWREDSTNRDDTHPRNFIRIHVLPKLTYLGAHDFMKGVERSRTLLEEDAVALAKLAEERGKLVRTRTGELQTDLLTNEPPALRRRILGSWIVETTGRYPNAGQMADLLRRLAEPASRGPAQPPLEIMRFGEWHLSAGMKTWCLVGAVDRHTDSAIQVAQAVQTLMSGRTIELPTRARLSLSTWPVPSLLLDMIRADPPDPLVECIVDSSKVMLPFMVRPRQPGDRFRPLGAPGERKLSDWLIDRKVPRAERGRLPVVIDRSGRVLWVPGFGPASFAALSSKTTEALRLTYQEPAPP